MTHGIGCRLEILSSGKPLHPVGDIFLTEDIHRGSRLTFHMEGTAAAPDLGQPVRVRVRSAGDGGDRDLETTLWCARVASIDDGRSRTCSVEAVDPLTFSALQRQFVSRAGRVPLLRLADQVLAEQPGRLPDLPSSTGESPQVPLEWLLQCDETGQEFLERMGRSIGRLIYWGRNGLRCEAIGGASSQSGDTARLRLGPDLESVLVTRGPDLDLQRLFWTDPESRRVSASSFEGDGVNGGHSGNGLARRIASSTKPEASARVGEVGNDGWGTQIRLEMTRPDLALGTAVEISGHPLSRVASIEHALHAQGSYRNRTLCVPKERWGMGAAPRTRGLKGPFQAEISHNDDPLGQQRARVILSEDPERRPSPWLPVIAQSAGGGRGLYWLPEVRDLVLVVADAERPEALV